MSKSTLILNKIFPKNRDVYESIIIIIIVIIIGIQPLGRFGQRPEFSQATGMTLVRCILGKFLLVVCYCFPPRLEVPTFHQVSPRRERSQRRNVGENVVR